MQLIPEVKLLTQNNTLTKSLIKLLQPTRRKKQVNLTNYTSLTNTAKPVMKILLEEPVTRKKNLS